jgi:hypothetical protein
MTSESISLGGLTETSIKVIIFSGSRNDWEDCEFMFMACAVLYCYNSILTGALEVPKYNDIKEIMLMDATTTNDKQLLQLYRLNGITFSHLVSSINFQKEGG